MAHERPNNRWLLRQKIEAAVAGLGLAYFLVCGAGILYEKHNVRAAEERLADDQHNGASAATIAADETVVTAYTDSESEIRDRFRDTGIAFVIGTGALASDVIWAELRARRRAEEEEVV